MFEGIVCFDLLLTELRGCVSDKQLKRLSSFEYACLAFLSSESIYALPVLNSRIEPMIFWLESDIGHLDSKKR